MCVTPLMLQTQFSGGILCPSKLGFSVTGTVVPMRIWERRPEQRLGSSYIPTVLKTWEPWEGPPTLLPSFHSDPEHRRVTTKHPRVDITHRCTNPSVALLACKLLVSLLPMNLDILYMDSPGGAKAEATLPFTPSLA